MPDSWWQWWACLGRNWEHPQHSGKYNSGKDHKLSFGNRAMGRPPKSVAETNSSKNASPQPRPKIHFAFRSNLLYTDQARRCHDEPSRAHRKILFLAKSGLPRRIIHGPWSSLKSCRKVDTSCLSVYKWSFNILYRVPGESFQLSQVDRHLSWNVTMKAFTTSFSVLHEIHVLSFHMARMLWRYY